MTIEYANVDRLGDIRTRSQDDHHGRRTDRWRIWCQGAVEGNAAASVINAPNPQDNHDHRHRRGDLKAGRSELLLRTHTFEPATLHALAHPCITESSEQPGTELAVAPPGSRSSSPFGSSVGSQHLQNRRCLRISHDPNF